MLEIGPQRHLQTTTELEFTDSGVVVLNSATRNAKSKAQLRPQGGVEITKSCIAIRTKMIIQETRLVVPNPSRYRRRGDSGDVTPHVESLKHA